MADRVSVTENKANVLKITNITMRRFRFRKIKRWYKNIHQLLFPLKEFPVMHHVYDVRELFFQENDNQGFSRYDIIVRLLAIENYYGENDFGWVLYRKMQNKRKGEEWETAEERFVELIKSYEKNGYDDKSEILINYDLHLWNGSHRIALALFHKSYSVSCQLQAEWPNVDYGINWFIENDFSVNEITEIKFRFERLKNEIQVPFVCTLWAPVAPFYDEIIERLKLVCEVDSYRDYMFNTFNYTQMARKIYAVDDIEKWKIEKKIEYMKQNIQDDNWVIRVVKLNLNQPRFRRKDSTQNTLSVECEDIKRIIRNCYKDKLPNYFHDIICHIGDNFYQNEFIDKLFQYQFLNVAEIIDAISSYEYVLTKTDVPYMPSDFPKNYPLGKDMDIICSKSDFNTICEKIVISLHSMSLPYSINVIDKSKYHKMIRVELDGHLIYQFDIASELLIPNADFIPQMLKRRVGEQNYYKPILEDELVIRLYEVVNNKQKRHHIEYLQNHLAEFDAKSEEFLNTEAQDVLKLLRECANGESLLGGGAQTN